MDQSKLVVERKQIQVEAIDIALDAVRKHIDKVLSKHGLGAFASIHEILGVLEEERYELVMAIHFTDKENVREELLDIIQVCVFGLACINENLTDW